MERRYLVAALAIIATFAVVSRGFRSLERLSLRHAPQLEAITKLKSEVGAAQALAKVQSRLNSAYPNEAQLLAEMNVPLGSVQARLAEQLAKQKLQAAQSARASALWEADRARQQAMKLREKMARSNTSFPMEPISFEVNLSDDVQQQIDANTAALERRLAAQQLRMQKVANRLQASLNNFDSNPASVGVVSELDQDVSDGGIRVHCINRTSLQHQADQIARQAAREAMRQMEYSFSY
jgi:16S rRNA C967 or C1407 C5-methylase (RsmB/RsmF family)